MQIMMDIMANTDLVTQLEGDIETLETNTNDAAAVVASITPRVAAAMMTVAGQVVDNAANQMIIDRITFPRLIADFYSVNPTDLEVQGPFEAVGMGQFEVCQGEQFDFWASASAMGTTFANPMTTLQLQEQISGFVAKSQILIRDMNPTTNISNNFALRFKELDTQPFTNLYLITAQDAEVSGMMSNPMIQAMTF